MTYSRNIARLKESGRRNLQQGNAERTRTAQQRGITLESEAKDVATKLSIFSKTLNEWKQEDIKVKEYEGKMQLRKEQEERALTIGSHSEKIAAIESAREQKELLDEFESAEDQESAYQELKAKILELQGVDAYPDADRIAKLSPHQQVGYVKEKLRQAKLKYESQLRYSMANSEEPITIEGVTYTPKQLRDKNIQALPFKEAAVNVMAAKLRKSLGIDKYSDAMLKVSGMSDTIQTAKEKLMGEYRKRYNIDSSKNTQSQALLDYQTGKRGPKQAARFLLTYANTVNDQNLPMGNQAALDALFGIWKQEGVKTGGDTTVADKYGDMPLPEPLRKRLGAKPGTTFAQQWPARFTKLKQDIKSGFKSAVDAEKNNLQADLTALGNAMIVEHRTKGFIDRKRIDEYRMMSRMLGLQDSRIEDFITIQDEQVEQSKKRIKEQIAAQNGFISHEQLNEYHPEAALEFRKKADAFEKALKTKHRVEEKIKSALNRSWEDAGMKQKEKPVVWEYALARALEDYDQKFNDLVAMGYDADHAAKLALDTPAGGVTNKETGEQVVDFEGVVAEILRSGAGSKYTQEGQEAKDNLAEATLRVHEINLGKKEMLRDPFIFDKEIIGGEYGKERLQEIVQNIKDYGTWKGLSRSQDALFYYDGLARGKNGLTGHAIIDKQLKLLGHPGLYPARVTEVPDPDGHIQATEEAAQPVKYEGSVDSYNTVYLDLVDETNYYNFNGESQWNLAFQIPSHLGGEY